ncbi:uncharacterized protein LOC135848921 [Planococcus citri]|uniref:uncharacterized protein LOC135848921 n=1 Tax=Planococcus citri TaxID=170843 RepID=UPI0031FA3D6B
MNLAISALPFIISTLSILSNIEAADQNYPLYVTKTKNDFGYDLADPFSYNEVVNKRKFHDLSEKNQILLAACPMPDTTHPVLQVLSKTEEELADGFRCDEPVKYAIQNNADVTECKIGFSINMGSSDRSPGTFVIPDMFKYHIPLITVERKTTPDIAVPRLIVRHNIKYGKMLAENENYDQQSRSRPEYNKNIDIFHYDIDRAYKEDYQREFSKKFFRGETTSRLEKLQLAPADDFFFDSWKEASRNNINTTPVWGELMIEWRKLENFVRRVALVIEDLQIVTGGSNIDSSTPGAQQISYLYKSEDPLEEPLPVFELIFKTVAFNQQRQDGTWLRQGILFAMKNDPRDKVTAENELMEETGWTNYSNYISDRRIVAQEMNPRTGRWEHIDDNNVYEPLNLNKVRVLSLDENGKEFEKVVNVLEVKY